MYRHSRAAFKIILCEQIMLNYPSLINECSLVGQMIIAMMWVSGNEREGDYTGTT